MANKTGVLARSLFAMVFLVACVTAWAQTLELSPSRVMVDETAAIRARGLQPKEHVVLRARLTDGGAQLWSSEAEFVADDQGTVDSSRQAPVKGSYSDVSAMGLVWAMKPAAKGIVTYEPPRLLASQNVEFELLRNGNPVASAVLEQRAVADGVTRVRLEGQLHGVLFVPAGGGRHPGLLVVGGSEGGAPVRKAAWLASHGYAALALAYFRYDDLPPRLEAVPLEYFGRALAWMMGRSEILSERIGVVGTSRGGELALQLASMYPQIKAVVAYVPANVRYPACCGETDVPYAWTWKGQPLSFARPRLALRRNENLDAAIPVEQARGPVLLIAGEDDGVWPSSIMAGDIASRLRQAHFAYQIELLKYPHAGHRAGQPAIVPTWHGTMRHPVSGRDVTVGGNPKGDAESSLDAIPKVLAFLQQSLAAAGPSDSR